MQQTAVEWLCEQYHLKKDIEIVKQAIEMEKEQMRSASCPYIGGWEDDEFEYWYNEKYKK
jgi:hypothetical protein